MTRAPPLLALICWTQWCLAADVIQKPQFHIAPPADNITLNCEHDDSTYYTKYWYRQKIGKELVLIGYTINDAITMEPEFSDKKAKIQPNGTKISILTIYSASIQDSARYYCASSRQGANSVAYFGAGTVVNVLEPPNELKHPKVSIYRSSKREVEEHDFISLVCVARDFYPEHVKIKWLVNGVERVNLYEPVPQKTSNGSSYSTSKRLTLTRSEYFNPESKFECQAAFPNLTISRAEVSGEKDCSISKETYTIHINQGKISYIMILCKSGLYALVVLALLWRKKAIASSY